jgi:hypothetical protein
MHHLDPFGRLAPSSLDMSRAAARRHEHLEALRERDRAHDHSRPSRHPRHWLHLPPLRALRLLLG